MPLIGTLTSGVSALRTFSKGLEVIGGNIANVNTTAYKNASTSFADTFSNTVRTGGGAATAQIGSGVQLGAIATDFTQGSISSTGKPTDLAVSGNGYFVVKDDPAVATSPQYATRDGSFHFDSQDRLVNSQGKFVLSSTGGVIDITSGTAGVTISSYNISTDGTITVYYSDGTNNSAAAPKVGLLGIADQTKLVKQGGNLYDFGPTGALLTGIAAPASGSLGKIQSSALELSNVDLTDQFAELITTQRSFQAGSRLVTVSDSVLEDIVNLKRS